MRERQPWVLVCRDAYQYEILKLTVNGRFYEPFAGFASLEAAEYALSALEQATFASGRT
jgi:hypothetical protein